MRTLRRLLFPAALAFATLVVVSAVAPNPAQGQAGAPIPVPVQVPVPTDASLIPTTVAPVAVTSLPDSATPTAGDPTTTTTIPVAMVRSLEIVGHGFGHGRGLGQWGALGYATDQAWTYDRVLNYFYGGTTSGKVSPQSAVGVRLTGLDDRVLTVFHPSGRLWMAIGSSVMMPPSVGAPSADATSTSSSVPVPTPVPVPVPVPVASGTWAAGITPSTTSTVPNAVGAMAKAPAAVRIQLVSAGRFSVSDGPGCAGPWTLRGTYDAASVLVSPGPDPVADANDPAQMLSVCQGASLRRVYRGDLMSVDAKPGQRTVNQVSLENYIRGVVPGEVPPGWGSKLNGMEALKAQAVAARSYAAAEKRNGFSNTCDSDSCQVYRGRGQFRGTSFDSFEDVRTDKAVGDTAGEVRVNPTTGAVIRTEFSSSTGGQSAPGEFPPVVDEGDATAANPYRQWTVTLSATRLEAGRKLGAFRGIEIVKRDGVGQYGGRVHNLRLIYAQGSVAMTSGEFLRAFALRSTLFDAQVAEKAAASEKSTPDTTVLDGTRASPDTTVPADAAPPTTRDPAAKVSSAKSTTLKSAPAKKSAPTTTLAVEAVGATKVQAGSKARTTVDSASAPTTKSPVPKKR